MAGSPSRLALQRDHQGTHPTSHSTDQLVSTLSAPARKSNSYATPGMEDQFHHSIPHARIGRCECGRITGGGEETTKAGNPDRER